MAVMIPGNQTPGDKQFSTLSELVEAIAKEVHKAAFQGDRNSPTAGAYTEAEWHVLRQIQMDCFPGK